jgi:hypothetical protein
MRTFTAEDQDDSAAIMELLTGYGVAHITIEYSGGGDSGQIDEINVTGVADAQQVPLAKEHECMLGKPGTLKDLIDRWADGITEQLGYDWYNNDGGGGTITITPSEGKVDVDAHYFETQSVTAEVEDIWSCAPTWMPDYKPAEDVGQEVV